MVEALLLGCIFPPARTQGKNVFHFFRLTRSALHPLQNFIYFFFPRQYYPPYGRSFPFSNIFCRILWRGFMLFGSEFSPTYNLPLPHTHTHKLVCNVIYSDTTCSTMYTESVSKYKKYSNIHIVVFWVMTSWCDLLGGNKCLGGISCHQLQGNLTTEAVCPSEMLVAMNWTTLKNPQYESSLNIRSYSGVQL
jgi:hypothetical protein